jgi:hypothetical protein
VKKTSATALAVVVLSVVASATSCSAAASPVNVTRASASPVTPASPDAATLAMTLAMLRQVAVHGAATNQYTHFTPQQSSDAKLIAAFNEACTDLQGHKPADAAAMLMRSGWTGPEAVLITQNAASPDMFCPADSQAVDAWLNAGTS